MIRTLKFAAIFVGTIAITAGSAMASHCPTDVQAIDAALQSASVSDEQRAQIMSLRDEGASLHEAGNHSESEAKLHEAMQMLGIQH